MSAVKTGDDGHAEVFDWVANDGWQAEIAPQQTVNGDEVERHLAGCSTKMTENASAISEQ